MSERPPKLLVGDRPLPQLDLDFAEGSWLHLRDGRQLLDASSGLVCVNIGHANARVAGRVAEQLDRVAFAGPAVFNPDLQRKLAERLTDAVRRPDDSVAFSTSGTLGIEYSIAIARIAARVRSGPDRSKILTASLSYHGLSSLTLALSGHKRRRPMHNDAMGISPSFDAPYGPSHGSAFPQSEGDHRCTSACASVVADAIDRSAGQVAAVLIEPISGSSGGAFVPPEGFLRELNRLCHERDVLVIHDEVLTGLGRTGRTLASDHWQDASSDICVLSKGLGAGYAPVSAILVAPDVASALSASELEPLPMIGTMSATPLQAATCLGVLDELDCIGALGPRARGQDLETEVRRIGEDFSGLVETRGVGYLHGLELPKGSLWRFVAEAERQGLLLYPFSGFRDGGDGEGVLIAPPINSTDAEIRFLSQRLRNTIERSLSS